MQAMVDAAVTAHGQVDVLVNNAGCAYVGPVSGPRFVADARRLMEVDYFGIVHCARAILPIMKRQGKGHISNMCSVMGRKAFPNFAAYAASMHAIAAFSDSLRQELHGTGIGVSTIFPAITQTPMFRDADPTEMPPQFRYMTPNTPERVASAILKAVLHNKVRVVIPWQPRTLLAADAVSPVLGDLVARLMPTRTFMTLIGYNRGTPYQHR